MRILLILALIVPRLIFCAVITVPSPSRVHHAEDVHDRQLPGVWSHEPGHPVHALFRRAPGDGTTYAPVGTPEWSAGFPPPNAVPDARTIPQAWISALDAAVATGKIPEIPPANPAYPPGVNPDGPQVCSSSNFCRSNDSLWDAPDGVFASSFDDGPYPQTTKLVQFLRSRNLTTTHFMIGSNILGFPTQFLEAFDGGNDIAVHTWSHPHMSALSNINIVGELGWTMQVIHNSTGGRVPRFWRPPYGESDARVRAIAREVFGLETVIWNSDTADWTLGSAAQVASNLGGILSGRPKSPGLVTLEHEISDAHVDGFITAFPLIASNGWTFRSLANVLGSGRSYQNAQSSTSDDVTPKGVLRQQESPPPTTTSSTPIATPSSAPSPSPSSQQSGSQRVLIRRGTLSLFSLLSIILYACV